MTAAFQTIFDKQPDLKNTTQYIIDYLNSDVDTKPLEELNKRKIIRKMEGLLTLKELTEALFRHMRGASSPGIDSFTVNHLRTFLDDLSHIKRDALYCSFGGELTTSLRKSVIKFLLLGF